jgi:putative redox protein
VQINCVWQDNMKLVGSVSDHQVQMDAKKPFGGDSAMSPKELVVSGLCGCTAMDVVGLMKKHKQTIESFEIRADVATTEKGHPNVFTKIDLLFKLKGAIEPAILLESVHLSQSKYCGVSAMLSKAVPINYRVELNGKEIGTGTANFDT